MAAATSHPKRPLAKAGSERTAPSSAGSGKGFYVAAVASATGIAGGAIGFVLGVVPYYMAGGDIGSRDIVFAGCIALGLVLGLGFGLFKGPRWFREQEAAAVARQGRLGRYLQRKRPDPAEARARTLGRQYLEQMLGHKPKP